MRAGLDVLPPAANGATPLKTAATKLAQAVIRIYESEMAHLLWTRMERNRLPQGKSAYFVIRLDADSKEITLVGRFDLM